MGLGVVCWCPVVGHRGWVYGTGVCGGVGDVVGVCLCCGGAGYFLPGTHSAPASSSASDFGAGVSF